MPGGGLRSTQELEEGDVPDVPGVLARVVVDAQEIGGRRDDIHIAGLDFGPKGPRAFEQSCRVCAFVDAVQVEAVHKVVGEVGGVAMFGRFGVGIDGELAEGDADVQVGMQVADALYRQPVAEQFVVGHSKVFPRITDAGRVFADEMAEEGVFPGFVERDPVLDAVAQGLDDDLGIVGEIVGGIPTNEPAILLE